MINNDPLKDKLDKVKDKDKIKDLENLELNDSTAKEFFDNNKFSFEPGKVFFRCYNPSVYYPISFALIITIIISIISLGAYNLEVKNSISLLICALIVFFITLCVFITIKSETVIDYAAKKVYKRNHLFSLCFSNNIISFNNIDSVGVTHYVYSRTIGKQVRKTYHYHLTKTYIVLNDGSTYNFNNLGNSKSTLDAILSRNIALALKKEKIPNSTEDISNNYLGKKEDQYNKYLFDELLEILKYLPAYLLVIFLLALIYLPMYFLLK